jgi:hypothetical protein
MPVPRRSLCGGAHAGFPALAASPLGCRKATLARKQPAADVAPYTLAINRHYKFQRRELHIKHAQGGGQGGPQRWFTSVPCLQP